ncbi:uncharacterized protein [Diadema setosum]|uniref:uncharacterized protein n=1 Tax=Diadema setosum TaxID=31175 RepID=UPI003B39FFAC
MEYNLESQMLEIRNEYDNSTETVTDTFWGQYSLTEKVDFSNVRYCVRMQSVSLYDVKGPWSEQRCKYTPPREPNVDITDVSHSNEMNADQPLLRNVTVRWNVEMPTDEPYQGLLGFEVRTVQLSSETEQAQNMSLSEEYKLKLVKSGNFSFEIPDLLTNESYDIVITGYNEAGFSAAPRKHVVDPEYEKPKSVSGGSTLPVIVSVPVAMLVLIPMVLYVLYQKLKRNLNQFPEPVFTKTDQVKLRPGPEQEVFDQPTSAAKTEKEITVQIHLSQEYVTVVPSTADVPIVVKDRAASHRKQGYSQLSMECRSYTKIGTDSGGNGSTSPSSTANGVKDSSEDGSPVGSWTTSAERLAIDSGDTQYYISPERGTQGEGDTGVHPEVDKTKPTITPGLHLNGSPTGDAQGSILSEDAPDANNEISPQSAATSSYVPYQQKVSQMKTYIPVPVMSSALCQASGYVDPEALTDLTSAGTGKSIGGSEINLDNPNASPVHTVIDGHVSTSAELKSGCRGSSDELQSSPLEDIGQNASFVDDSHRPISDRGGYFRLQLVAPSDCVVDGGVTLNVRDWYY